MEKTNSFTYKCNSQKYGINWITSWLFVFNILHAYYRQTYLIMLGSFFCLVASLVNHSSYTDESQFIDRFMIVIWGITSILTSIPFNPYYAFSIMNVIGIMGSYFVSGHSHCQEKGIINHSMVHMLGVMGISFMIEACHHNKIKLQNMIKI